MKRQVNGRPIGKRQGAIARAGTMAAAAVVITMGLNACGGGGSSPPVVAATPTPTPTPTPTSVPTSGCLSRAANGDISCTTADGWRILIAGGAITVKPPTSSNDVFQYVSRGTRESLGTTEVRTWAGDRRSILLPGGTKITMQGQSGALLRVSLYTADQAHEVDVLTQTLMLSQASGGATRDDAEADGETAHLSTLQFGTSAPIWLYLSNIYSQAVPTTGAPGAKVIAVRPLARQVAARTDAYAAPAVLATEADQTCQADGVARGRLVRDPTVGAFTYTSRGGWTVKIDRHTITTTSPSGRQTWQVWGDPHENLNGKHIKDWLGTRRTLLLTDGTKITMYADSPFHVVHTTSIYDGAQSHEIGNAGNVVRHSCVNAATAKQRDDAEYDGETVFLAILTSPTSILGTMMAANIYEEAADFVRSYVVTVLGETGEPETNPNQVNDYYDDPRLGHT